MESSLEALALDRRKENPFRGPMRCHIWINVLKSLISSAQGGILKITVVFDVTTSSEYEETKLLETFFVMFGITAKHTDAIRYPACKFGSRKATVVRCWRRLIISLWLCFCKC